MSGKKKPQSWSLLDDVGHVSTEYIGDFCDVKDCDAAAVATVHVGGGYEYDAPDLCAAHIDELGKSLQTVARLL